MTTPVLVALLAWYDERPDMLRDTIASLPLAGVDHLVAVDGAYAAFPNAKAASPKAQRTAILNAAQKAGIGCTVHVPSSVWVENEPGKRRFMFGLAETLTTEDDWYLVIDADEVVLQAPDNLKTTLGGTSRDVAQAVLLEASAGNVIHGMVGEDDGENMPMVVDGRFTNHLPMLFRAVRGLSVAWAHNQYVTPDGRYLWAGTLEQRPEIALRLPSFHVDHRFNRSHERRTAATAYYYERETTGIERQPKTETPLKWPPNRFAPVTGVQEAAHG